MLVSLGKLSALPTIKKSATQMVSISYLLDKITSTPAPNRLAASPPRKDSTNNTLIYLIYYFHYFSKTKSG